MCCKKESCSDRGAMYLAWFLVLFSCLSCFVSPCNEADRVSLLSFLSSVSPSPSSAPLNWSASGPDCCVWDGVSCEGDQVTRVWLPFRGLTGPISPSLLNLSGLSHLNVSHNRLSGPLPAGFFSSLSQVQVLDLSFNRIYGELPPSLPSGHIIEVIDLSSNRFNGQIPYSIFHEMRNLVNFNVSNNTFTGKLPVSSICSVNSSQLIRKLDFSYNDFTGFIPSGLGECSKLLDFRAGFNNLSGQVPNDIFNATALRRLSLPVNRLTGPISDGILQLTKLVNLELYSNQFSGEIPRNIGMLSKLEQLQLHINTLTGPLPLSLKNCSNISILNLRFNHLRGRLSDFDFSAFVRLRTLDLGDNNFTGSLPESLFSCKSLAALRLASNQLEGQISPGILGLQSLSFLSLSKNRLTNITGAIRNLMGCRNLTTVIFSKNFMHEVMPAYEKIGDPIGFQNVQVLGLGGSNLTGQVPLWLAKLRSLEVVDLSYNQITGHVPGWLGNLQNLFYLDLSNNLIAGGFPKELTTLPALASKEVDEVDRSYLELPVFVNPNNATNQQYNQLSNLPPALYLKNNKLSGSIPVEIGQLKFLHVLDFSGNNFTGSIPAEISNLTNLEKLDLSKNHLSGEIPVSLRGLHFLSSFSVANNNLQGQIPTGGQFDTFPNTSFEGNPRLCAQAIQRPCSDQSVSVHPTAQRKSIDKRLLIGLVLGICFATGSIITMLSLWILSKRRIIPRGDNDKVELDTISSYSITGGSAEADKDASLVILFPSSNQEVMDLTISEILKATDNFNQENIIGCGGFGLVYKATLANGTKLAVKKLSGDLGLMDREFKAEVEALSMAQHENLVSLRGYCVHEGDRLLIYSYMENGSLDYWLHEKEDGASQLDWPTRLKIARGAGYGLAYMHQICDPHIVHRDIKSSNILLDEKFEAHVADFGLARLILPYRTHVTTELVGTLGYIPPEYGQAWVATLRGDVYSFGVVMLELLTGKRPVEVFKPKMSRDLVGWVQQMRSEAKQDEIFDPRLRGKGYEEEMLQVLDVACMCVNQNPFKRPTITEVVDWLKNVGEKHRQ